MISISGSEALLGAALLLLVELSIHLRFRPLKAQLDTIEILLRRDQGQLLVLLRSASGSGGSREPGPSQFGG